MSNNLDTQSVEMIKCIFSSEIKLFINKLNKHEKIRADLWVIITKLKKLKAIQVSAAQKKNRNQYIRSLLRMVSNGKLEVPFSKLPPDGCLPKCPRLHIQYQSKLTPKKDRKSEKICDHQKQVQELQQKIRKAKAKTVKYKNQRAHLKEVLQSKDIIIQELKFQLTEFRSKPGKQRQKSEQDLFGIDSLDQTIPVVTQNDDLSITTFDSFSNFSQIIKLQTSKLKY